MATLRDMDYDETKLSLQMSFSVSDWYDGDPHEWVENTVTFSFGKALPAISKSYSSDEFYGYHRFAQELMDLVVSDKPNYEFEPMEPDFTFLLTRGPGKLIPASEFSLHCSLDIAQLNNGAYFGRGVGINFDVSSEDLLGFAKSMERELKQVERRSKHKLRSK